MLEVITLCYRGMIKRGIPLGGELRFTVTPVGTVTCRVTIGASTWTFAGRLHIEPGDDVAETYLFSQGAPTVSKQGQRHAVSRFALRIL